MERDAREDREREDARRVSPAQESTEENDSSRPRVESAARPSSTTAGDQFTPITAQQYAASSPLVREMEIEALEDEIRRLEEAELFRQR